MTFFVHIHSTIHATEASFPIPKLYPGKGRKMSACSIVLAGNNGHWQNISSCLSTAVLLFYRSFLSSSGHGVQGVIGWPRKTWILREYLNYMNIFEIWTFNSASLCSSVSRIASTSSSWDEIVHGSSLKLMN